LIQKGTSLSSFPDDAEKLKKFSRIDGIKILDMSKVKMIEQTSIANTFATMKKAVYAAANKAVQSLNVSHQI
jgi:hypothetical protein